MAGGRGAGGLEQSYKIEVAATTTPAPTDWLSLGHRRPGLPIFFSRVRVVSLTEVHTATSAALSRMTQAWRGLISDFSGFRGLLESMEVS